MTHSNYLGERPPSYFKNPKNRLQEGGPQNPRKLSN